MRKRRDQGKGGETAAPGAASRAFLQLSEGNEIAAQGPSTARKVVAVAIAALYLLSVPLLWATTADAGKAVRPAASGPGHDGSGDDNSGPSGSGGDDDDDSANSAATKGTGSRDSARTKGTTRGTRNKADSNDSRHSANTRGTGSRDSARTAGTTRGTRG